MTQLGLCVVEPDPAFGRLLVGFFAQHGLAAELHHEARPLLNHLAARPPRLVLLGDGGELAATLQLLRRIRELSRVPCLALLGAPDDLSEIVVLEAGADAVIGRTVPLRAMLARVRAVLRRAEWGPGVAVAQGGGGGAPSGHGLGGWHLLPQRRQLLRPDGSECPLTTAEFDLVALLIGQQGKAVTRDAIADGVFRRPFRAEDRTVDNLVLRLRRKLGPAQENAIKTVRGAGYMFAGFVEAKRRVA
jgi:DNA-binding response OmpR family regulator